MATHLETTDVDSQTSLESRRRPKSQSSSPVLDFLYGIASLKLTVVLFALSVFLVLAGTLAQTEADIWAVVRQYFRVWFAWIEFKVFLPPAWFPTIDRNSIGIPIKRIWITGFWFPGGWLLGSFMTANLLCAHALRFKSQAKGIRLTSGIFTIIVGIIATFLVIQTGSMGEGRLQAGSLLSESTVWKVFLGSLLVTGILSIISAAKTPSKKTGEFWLYGLLGLGLTGCSVWLFLTPSLQIDDSGMRILWQLLKGTGASLVLLAGCWLVFKKRAGIVLLHAGVLLLMANELNVHMNHVESQMRLEEGETKNYAEDIRDYELAIIDRSAPDTDTEVTVPAGLLKKIDTTLSDAQLPFTIKPLRYMVNSDVRELKEGETPLANKGQGAKIFAEEVAPITGVDSGRVDMPSLVAELIDTKTGDSLGTWLFTLFTKEQPIQIGEKTYDVGMRFERHYKDYSVHLIDVSRDDYVGTNTPRNYSSDVQIVDLKDNSTRQAHIWMNNPLRFAGETFYQSGYNPPAPALGMMRESTVLSVTSNEGWMMPYVACMIVAIGMLAQFILTLTRFLNRQAAPARVAGEDDAPVPSRYRQPAWAIGLTTILVVTFGGYILSKLRPQKDVADAPHIVAFGEIPIVYEGRTKPIDTLARNTLRILNQRETAWRPVEIKLDDVGNPIPGGVIDGEYKDVKLVTVTATQWLLDLIARPDIAEHDRVLKIDNDEVLALLQLPKRKVHVYSPAEIMLHQDKFDAEIKSINEQVEAGTLSNLTFSPYQRKLKELYGKLNTLLMVRMTFSPPEIDPNPETIWKQIAEALGAIRRFDALNPPLVIPPSKDIDWAKVKTEWASHQLLNVVYPLVENEAGNWTTFRKAWMTNLLVTWFAEQKGNEFNEKFVEMLSTYGDYNVEKDEKGVDKNAEENAKAIAAFNTAVADYHKLLATAKPKDYQPSKVNFEYYFNATSPFYYSGVNYLAALVCVLLGWVAFNSRPLSRAFNTGATGILIITFAVHIFALVARMYISGRPPVTNLYSSAIFIGWAGVLAGLLLEPILKHGLGNIIAAVAGFATILIADGLWMGGGLAATGDTMTVLQAVLDTQFWLATHVVTVTLGYAATFIGGLLGVVYILRGVFTSTLGKLDAKQLLTTIYGSLCFALFFSFVGTVLGGLWADDSWGRFWGWDPKENGALIIVLWNALVLHARWDGMAKGKGLAILAVAGNIATCWSWFGVNELGVGLHSYGFTEGVLMYLAIFVISQLVVIGLGMLPTKVWASRKVLA